ncbi:D-alanine--D-alanine ligase family protein [Hippea alviniae]|uniref:D-alanine--D-alanine ligase family protein n=1 Tax=Hippea alviniae TaxID=1279027 RepID=UPI00041391FD|nr:D-alanine--D-alanine ligase [Hippea alviniae]
MKVAIVCGGDSSEREVSLSTGHAVFEAAKKSFDDVVCIECNDSKDCLNKIIESKADVVFIALHGGFGENGQIQAALEIFGIKHTGCTFSPSNITMNKFLTKMLLKANNIPTAEAVLIRDKNDLNRIDFAPVCIKPNNEGSSVGVSFADSIEDAKRIAEAMLKDYREVLVEKRLKGKELTVGVLFGKALPVIHIKPKSGFYDYKNKYTKGATEYIVPADIDNEIAELVKQVATEAYKAVGCDSYARVDLILENNIPYVLEINSIPGMTATSLLPKAAAADGMSFEELVRLLIEKAC